MSSEWHSLPASEFCESVRDGTHDSPKEVPSGGRNLVTSRHIKGGVLDLEKSYKISVDDFNEINRRSKVDQWDILFSMIGTVGETLLVKDRNPNFAIKNVGLFKNKNELSGRWLYYFLNSPDTKTEIESLSRGTTQQYVPLGALRSLQIRFPSSNHCQQKIVDILSTLDDKIELNRKTNETLEGIAKALFKSWFVDFDPVRAKAEGRLTGLPDEISELFPDSFEGSELGEIPSGWSTCGLDEAATWMEGKPWRKEQRVDASDVATFGANGVIGCSTDALGTGRVIFVGKIGSCGAINNYNGRYWATNNTFLLSESVNPHLEFVRCLLDRVDFSLYVGGSSNPYMPLKNFGGHSVISPPSLLVEYFCQRVVLLRQRIELAEDQSRTLSSLRDVLLPKLISGELRVPDAETMLEEVGI